MSIREAAEKLIAVIDAEGRLFDIDEPVANLRAAIAEKQPGLDQIAANLSDSIVGCHDGHKRFALILAALQAAVDVAKKEQREVDARIAENGCGQYAPRFYSFAQDIAQAIRGVKA